MFCLVCLKKPILVTLSREATTDYLNNILSVKKLTFLKYYDTETKYWIKIYKENKIHEVWIKYINGTKLKLKQFHTKNNWIMHCIFTVNPFLYICMTLIGHHTFGCCCVKFDLQQHNRPNYHVRVKERLQKWQCTCWS